MNWWRASVCQSLSYGCAVASESAAGKIFGDGQYVVAAADQTVVAMAQEKVPWRRANRLPW
jgi:hypothetical protein